MKYLLILTFIFLGQFKVQAETVQLKISNMNGEMGQLALAIYNNASSFPDDSKRAFATKFVAINTRLNSQVVTLDLPAGDYAIAIFLDKNKNGSLDKNLVGVPKERFGFSNNPTIRFGAPSFSECEFNVSEKKLNSHSINLIKFL
jgi:uncharacterized protein (DUF2141 family)